METGIIPPNLHYKSPKKSIQSLVDKRITVVADPTPWNGGYVGINSLGYGGSNAHVLLKSHDKEKINNGEPLDNLPRLVVASGCTKSAVDTILKNVNYSSYNTHDHIFWPSYSR